MPRGRTYIRSFEDSTQKAHARRECETTKHNPNMDPKHQTAGAGGGAASGRELRELFSFGLSNRMLGEGERTGEATASAITIGHGGGPLRLGARARMVVDLGVSASADVFAAEIAAGDQHTLVRLSNGELRALAPM